jgi:hypothetical protein
VDCDSIDVGHFIEFIDTDNASVGEDHGSCFKATFPGFFVSGDCGGETDAGRSTTGGCDSERGGVQDEAEHLRFCRRRVTNHQNVDISGKLGCQLNG